MKAEYNHWYKCQEGQMPEDFENVNHKEVLLFCTDNSFYVDNRVKRNVWQWQTVFSDEVLAWMLPEPYVEQ